MCHRQFVSLENTAWQQFIIQEASKWRRLEIYLPQIEKLGKNPLRSLRTLSPIFRIGKITLSKCVLRRLQLANVQSLFTMQFHHKACGLIFAAKPPLPTPSPKRWSHLRPSLDFKVLSCGDENWASWRRTRELRFSVEKTQLFSFSSRVWVLFHLTAPVHKHKNI